MLTKLKNLESLYILQQYNQLGIKRNHNYLTIGNFISNLNYIFELLNNDKHLSDELFLYTLIYLHNLLCYSFITRGNVEINLKDFKVLNREIILGIYFPIEIITNNLKQLEKLIIDSKQKLGYCLLKTKLNLFIKRSNEDINNNVEPKQSLKLTIHIDKK